MDKKTSGTFRATAAIAAATLLSALAAFASCRPSAGKAPTPGPDEARRAWNAVAGPTPRPIKAPEPIDLGFLKPLFDFIAKNRLPIGILGGIALLGFCLWLLFVARRRSAPGRIVRSVSKEIKAAAKEAPIGAEASSPLYARALEAAAAGDYSRASVFLRRARVAELAESGALPARRESGDAEIARADESCGAPPGAYRFLARAADSVLFGRKVIGEGEWTSLLALRPVPGSRTVPGSRPVPGGRA